MRGLLRNYGITVVSEGTRGAQVVGTGNFENYGMFYFHSHTELGILNGGNFINQPGAILEVTNVPTGLINQQLSGDTLTPIVKNQSVMNFGSAAGPISGAAIVNNANVENFTLININNAFDGLVNTYLNIPVTFTNFNTLDIGSTGQIGRYGIWNNSAVFTNVSLIRIDQTVETAFLNTTASPNPTGQVLNSGPLHIGQNAGPNTIASSQTGNTNPAHGALYNSALMTNLPTGIIKINQSAGYGVYNTLSVDLVNQGLFEIGTGGVINNVAGIGLINNVGPFTNDPAATLQIENTGNTALSNNGDMDFVNKGLLLIGIEGGSVIDGYGVINNEASFHNTSMGTAHLSSYTNYGFFSTSPAFDVNQSIINDGQLMVGNLATTSIRPFVNQRVTFTNTGSSHFNSTADFSFLNTVDGIVTNDTCGEIVVNGPFYNDGQVNNNSVFILESNVNNVNSSSVVNNGVVCYLEENEIPNVINNGTIVHRTFMPGNCVNGMREYPNAFELGINHPPSEVWKLTDSISAGTYDLGSNKFIANDNVESGYQTLYVSFPTICDKVLPWVINGGGDIDMDGYLDCADLCPDSLDTSLDFDGNNDHISVPHDVALNLGSGDFTLQAWVKPTGTDWKTVVSKGGGGVTGTNYIFSIDPSNNQAFFFAGVWHYSNTTIPANTWSHVAVSFNATTKQATFYVNGMADGLVSYPGAPYISDTNPLLIGQQGYSCVCHHFEGSLDDVVIWNIAKSPSEVLESMTYPLTGLEPGMVAHYDFNEAFACVDNTATTTVLDNSPNGFNGTVTNFTLTAGCTSNWSSGRNLDSDNDGTGDACNDIPCPISLTLTGNQILNANYLTDGFISSNQIILSPAAVEYNSATSVELIYPFEVQIGATLTTKNDGCD